MDRAIVGGFWLRSSEKLMEVIQTLISGRESGSFPLKFFPSLARDYQFYIDGDQIDDFDVILSSPSIMQRAGPPGWAVRTFCTP